jgi:hypothetical protein
VLESGVDAPALPGALGVERAGAISCPSSVQAAPAPSTRSRRRWRTPARRGAEKVAPQHILRGKLLKTQFNSNFTGGALESRLFSVQIVLSASAPPLDTKTRRRGCRVAISPEEGLGQRGEALT